MRVTTYEPGEVRVLKPSRRVRLARKPIPRRAQHLQSGKVIQSRKGRGPCWRVLAVDGQGLPYCRDVATGVERTISRPENYVVVG